MNIGIDIKALKYKPTGICKYIRSILDELQQIDTENRYCLFECTASDYKPVNPNWKKISQNLKVPGTVWQQVFLPGLIKKMGIDVFWAPEQICPVSRIPSDIKIITTVLDFTPIRFPETCTISVWLIFKLLLTATIKKSSALIPISGNIKNELITFYPFLESAPKIIKTIKLGAETWNNAGRPVQRENFLFFPGSLEPRKNLTRLIKALETVNSSGFNIPLHICGPKGWKNSDFHELVRSSPIKDRIKHLGYLSEEDLRNQYLKCKALIFPSIYEGFGLPVLEALKSGTPVLTSKGTVMEEIAGANAMYFDPYDVDSIAETIIRFLKSGGPVIDQTSLDGYTWRNSAETLLEVFNMLKQRPKRSD